jgi:chromate transporter
MSRVPLSTVAREWGRIGVTGFGGPPAHVALLRRLVVERYGWMDAEAFEHANAATGLLPGPASTQLALFCARQAAGGLGAVVGGLAFILPGLAMILALSVLFLSSTPPLWVLGAGGGAGAAVPAVAVAAGWSIVAPGWRRSTVRVRFAGYVIVGAFSSAVLGEYVVLALLACGFFELGLRASAFVPLPLAVATGGTGALVWTAFKVGALSYGGGFVIIPLMQHDAVNTYHWMTNPQFLNAVALGQITPGPVVLTTAAVGYAAGGVAKALLAATVAFSPSFLFVLLGAERFERLRGNTSATAFLRGAGPAAAGAILGASVPLTRALHENWQYALLAASAVALLALRRSVVSTLLAAGAIGTIVALAGGPVS